jgi:hypothetical protein
MALSSSTKQQNPLGNSQLSGLVAEDRPMEERKKSKKPLRYPPFARYNSPLWSLPNGAHHWRPGLSL